MSLPEIEAAVQRRDAQFKVKKSAKLMNGKGELDLSMR